jgi:hypothetical protein
VGRGPIASALHTYNATTTEHYNHYDVDTDKYYRRDHIASGDYCNDWNYSSSTSRDNDATAYYVPVLSTP